MTDLIGGTLPLFPAVGSLVLQHLQALARKLGNLK